MDDESIKLIVDEIAPLLTGRSPGKIFELSPTSLAIDFGTREGYLLISVDPAVPRLHLIKRRVRELERQSRPLTQFGLALKKQLEQTKIASIEKDPGDRIVRFKLAGQTDLGEPKTRTVVVQLTGRSANVLLLDEQSQIIQLLRSSSASPQVGEPYQPSNSSAARTGRKQTDLLSAIRSGKFPSASEAADHYFTTLFVARDLAARIAAARSALRRRTSQQEKLFNQLQNDLRQHDNPEQHKRIGDLLLANLSTARRIGDRVLLIDYFAEGTPAIEIEVDETTTLQQEAARRFALYAKSKRAIEQINLRLHTVRSRLRELEAKTQAFEEKIAAGDTSVLDPQTSGAAKAATQKKDERERIPGTRRYLSSDDYEILVGRTAQDNDHLTFKVAKPNDLWLHAADYGGSHVVVRNSTRKDIPHRTLIEAAQLAAYFSQAKKSPKVDVHYTQRKFVAKIKGGKPGLVRLQRYKNITVQPNEAGSRI